LEYGNNGMVDLFEEYEFKKKEYTVPEAVKFEKNSTKLQKLIDENADINKQTIDFSTGLHIAAQKGNFELVKMLLDAKANPKLKDKCGKIPLHYAIEDSKKDIVKELLTKCDPDAVDNNGFTALLYAAENGSRDVVKLLINSKMCDREFSDKETCRTALHKAAHFGHKSVVELLLKSGCKIKKRSERNYSS